MTTHYLAIDPGDTTGWAVFDEEGKAQDYGQAITKDSRDIRKLLRSLGPKVLIVEDFELFPWKSMSMGFDTLQTVRRIGNIETWAEMNNVPIHLQKPQIKTIGYKWAGMTKPKNHAISHGTDAYVHGVYFLQKAGIRKPQQGAN